MTLIKWDQSMTIATFKTTVHHDSKLKQDKVNRYKAYNYAIQNLYFPWLFGNLLFGNLGSAASSIGVLWCRIPNDILF